MKTEEHAWRDLHHHAAAQLPSGFADRVLRVAHGPQSSAWAQLRAEGSAQLRPGFADRVLRAARELKAGVPSLFGQFAVGAVTVAVCLAAVLYVHARSARAADERALAYWQQLAAETQDLDATL